MLDLPPPEAFQVGCCGPGEGFLDDVISRGIAIHD